MADPLQSSDPTDPFPTAPPADKPAAPSSPAGSNVVDLFPTKGQVQNVTAGLTQLQTEKIKSDDVMMRSFNQRDEQNRARMEQAFKAQGAEVEKLKPWNAQEELGKRETSLWEQFGSPGFLIAMMGSAFSAMPMNSALSAGGAAINAINQGKMADYQRAFDAWRQNTDLVIKRQQIEHQMYEEIDHLRHSDMAAWNARASAIATRFDDVRKRVMLENGMGPEVMQAIDGEIKSAKELATTQDLITKAKERMDILNADPRYHDPRTMKQAIDDLEAGRLTPEQDMWAQFKREEPNATSDRRMEVFKDIQAGKYAGRGAQGPLWDRANQLFPNDPQKQADWVGEQTRNAKQMKPEQEAFNAFISEYKAAHNGEPPSAEAMAENIRANKTVRSPQAMAMIEFIQEQKQLTGKGPTAEGMQQFIARGGALSAAERAFASGPEAKLVRSLNVGFSHAETFRELGHALKNGEIQKFNELAQKWARETGKPEPTNFELAKKFIGPEIVKALVQGGGGVTERTGMEESFAAMNSPEQIDQAIDTAEAFLAGQFKGLEHQYQQTTGEQNFEDKLLPQARDVYDRLSSKTFAQKQPVAVGPNTRNDKDGTKYRKDGWIWEKQGDKLVPIEAMK